MAHIAMILSAWDESRTWLVRGLGQLAGEQTEFRAFPEARSAREMVLHLAERETGLVRGALEDRWEAASGGQGSTGTLPWVDALRRLHEVRLQSRQALRGLTDEALARVVQPPWGPPMPAERVLWMVLVHESHHIGQFFGSLRLMGLRPPAFSPC